MRRFLDENEAFDFAYLFDNANGAELLADVIAWPVADLKLLRALLDALERLEQHTNGLQLFRPVSFFEAVERLSQTDISPESRDVLVRFLWKWRAARSEAGHT